MESNRREFLKGTAWMGAAAVAAGCMSAKQGPGFGAGGSMFGFAAKPIKKIRVGIAGIGSRGRGAVHRIASIPGVEVAALCDVRQCAVDGQQKWLKNTKRPPAKEFVGKHAYKAMCDWDGIDCVYNTTPWELHVPIALCAMRAGKHAFVEVPSAFTVEECWELVETSEKTRMNCMQLENCCYGEAELLALNMCRLGLLGELVHGEGAYIHDLRVLNYNDLLARLRNISNENSAFSVILYFFSVKEEGYVKSFLGECNCRCYRDRNTFISRTIKNCALVAYLFKISLCIKLSELSDLITSLNITGIYEIRYLSPTLCGKITELKNACIL